MKPSLVRIDRCVGKDTYRTYAPGKIWPGIESTEPLSREDVELLRAYPQGFATKYGIDLETP